MKMTKQGKTKKSAEKCEKTLSKPLKPNVFVCKFYLRSIENLLYIENL